MKKIGLIIPLHNEEKRVKKILDVIKSVKINRARKISEVVFVDNGSNDHTFEAAARIASDYEFDINLVSYRTRIPKKDAARLGLEAARADINIVLESNLSNLNLELRKVAPKKAPRKKIKTPTLSVVMPVYNAEKYLRLAVQSVMKQTFRDFEFIIVDDCSTDKSYKILMSLAKRYPKIKLFRNEKNLKQAKTVNFAISKARGDFIARMDADDISLPNRFERQIEYLRANKKTVAVGSQCLIIDSEGKITGEKTFPTTFEDIYEYIFKFCPAQQPSLMIARKRLPRDFEFYDHDLSPVEDTEFIFKLFRYGKVENMLDYFLLYRIHGKNSSLMSYKKSFLLTLLSRIKGVTYHGYQPTAEGILFTIAQAVAIFLLPQKLSEKAYKFIKNEDKKKSRFNSHKRLAYRFAKSI